jgi:hypothetical protein
MNSMAFRDKRAKLRGLAGEPGYELDKAPISGTWFLVDERTGERAMSDRGTTAFGVENAIKFLVARPPIKHRF